MMKMKPNITKKRSLSGPSYNGKELCTKTMCQVQSNIVFTLHLIVRLIQLPMEESTIPKNSSVDRVVNTLYYTPWHLPFIGD